LPEDMQKIIKKSSKLDPDAIWQMFKHHILSVYDIFNILRRYFLNGS
jgi:hypothetical protein